MFYEDETFGRYIQIALGKANFDNLFKIRFPLFSIIKELQDRDKINSNVNIDGVEIHASFQLSKNVLEVLTQLNKTEKYTFQIRDWISFLDEKPENKITNKLEYYNILMTLKLKGINREDIFIILNETGELEYIPHLLSMIKISYFEKTTVQSENSFDYEIRGEIITRFDFIVRPSLRKRLLQIEEKLNGKGIDFDWDNNSVTKKGSFAMFSLESSEDYFEEISEKVIKLKKNIKATLKPPEEVQKILFPNDSYEEHENDENKDLKTENIDKLQVLIVMNSCSKSNLGKSAANHVVVKETSIQISKDTLLSVVFREKNDINENIVLVEDIKLENSKELNFPLPASLVTNEAPQYTSLHEMLKDFELIAYNSNLKKLLQFLKDNFLKLLSLLESPTKVTEQESTYFILQLLGFINKSIVKDNKNNIFEQYLPESEGTYILLMFFELIKMSSLKRILKLKTNDTSKVFVSQICKFYDNMKGFIGKYRNFVNLHYSDQNKNLLKLMQNKLMEEKKEFDYLLTIYNKLLSMQHQMILEYTITNINLLPNDSSIEKKTYFTYMTEDNNLEMFFAKLLLNYTRDYKNVCEILELLGEIFNSNFNEMVLENLFYYITHLFYIRNNRTSIFLLYLALFLILFYASNSQVGYGYILYLLLKDIYSHEFLYFPIERSKTILLDLQKRDKEKTLIDTGKDPPSIAEHIERNIIPRFVKNKWLEGFYLGLLTKFADDFHKDEDPRSSLLFF